MRDHDYRIGNFYRVPCVRPELLSTWPYLLPILGPLHEDAEFIGFEEMHWHIDWRFVPEPWFRDRQIGRENLPWSLLGIVISKKNVLGEIEYRRLKCKREMLVMEECGFRLNAPTNERWCVRLEAAFRNTKIGADMICPHKGISMRGCPVKENILVCPGHGLAWNVETGQLVERSKEKLLL